MCGGTARARSGHANLQTGAVGSADGTSEREPANAGTPDTPVQNRREAQYGAAPMETTAATGVATAKASS
eukprot:5014556-Lingulodinium_polyedra.AAC.1